MVLDEPVTGIAPATLADAGSARPHRALASCARPLFTAVGYGTEVRKPDAGPQKPTPMSYPLIRRYVEMPGQKLTPQILQTNGNDKDNAGTGGTCFGDSGGPVFLDGEIVAVTSYGYTGVLPLPRRLPARRPRGRAGRGSPSSSDGRGGRPRTAPGMPVCGCPLYP